MSNSTTYTPSDLDGERDQQLARYLMGLSAADSAAASDELLPYLSSYKSAYVQQDAFTAPAQTGRLWDGIAAGMNNSERQAVSSDSQIDQIKSRDAQSNVSPIAVESLDAQQGRRASDSRKNVGVQPVSIRTSWSFALRAAAILAVALLGGLLLWTVTPSPAEELILSASSETVRFELEDGSVVTLRPNSSVRQLAAQGYSYTLQGEAHFDVVSNPGRDFIVTTASAQVQVTGTRFVVRSYEAETEVFLQEGGVNLTGVESGQTVAMTAGEAFVVKKGWVSQLELADANRYVLWMNNEMLLSNRTLHDITRELAHHFNIRIDVAEELRAERLDGSLTLDRAEAVLNDIALTLGSNVRKTEGGFVIE